MLSFRSIGQVWLWSRRRRPVSDTQWAGQDLQIGTHLVASRRGYTHHGIYVGREMVVHYAGFSRFLRSGPIEEVTLRRFSLGRTVRIARYSESIFSPNEIVQRARSRIGENQYHVLRNNCEHFCHWCMTDRSRSRQVDDPLAIVVQAFEAAEKWARQLRMNITTLCSIFGRAIAASAGSSSEFESAR